MRELIELVAGNVWIQLIVPSAAAGAIAGVFVNRRKSAIVAGAVIPWLGLLALLLYHEYFLPYAAGGASMWPVAQLFGGTFAAVVGGMTAAFVQRRRKGGKVAA